MSLYSFYYCTLNKLAHRFDWHRAIVYGPIAPDGTYQRWCQWCGFRETYRYDPKNPPRTIGPGLGGK